MVQVFYTFSRHSTKRAVKSLQGLTDAVGECVFADSTMFSAQFGREREHDPVQVRYGGLVNNVFQRHMLNLELLLDRALSAVPCDGNQERMAFAIAEVLFKATALPPVGLVHRVLGLLWGQAEGTAFMRNAVQLFTNIVCPLLLTLTRTSALLLPT